MEKHSFLLSEELSSIASVDKGKRILIRFFIKTHAF
jgi:hypothetical protein